MKRVVISVLFLLNNYVIANTTSAVYNLRIAETTKRVIFKNRPIGHPYVADAVVLGTWRKDYSGSTDAVAAGLGSFVYTPPSYYLRLDFAAGHAHEKSVLLGTSTRNQMDDIVITGGYSKFIHEHSGVTFSGLIGIPTHKDKAFTGAQFGVGHPALGVQIDGEHMHYGRHGHFVTGAARFIHFFPRSVPVPLPTGTECFKFTPGNLVDLYIAYMIDDKKEGFEVGYNPSFLFDARLCPELDVVSRQVNYIRSSFYGAYKRLIMVHDLFSAITLAASYGFDHRPKDVGNKHIVTVWAAWGIKF